jgi:heterodisulfide reductase subunit D
MIYFRGCVVREKLGNLSQATEKILKKSDVDYRVLDDETCCGSFLLRTGFQNEALDVMKKTLDDLKGEKILVSCAGCYNTLKNDYKNLLGAELDVIHTSQFFNDLINEGKLKVKKNPVNVTYHDPCHLGRHCGVYDEPREVLNKTANLVEMEKNRENSRCCGAGAGVKSAFPETAMKIAEKRIRDAENTRSDLIVTSCSFCILNLGNALEIFKMNKKDSTRISRVLDISEIVLMGIEDEEV